MAVNEWTAFCGQNTSGKATNALHPSSFTDPSSGRHSEQGLRRDRRGDGGERLDGLLRPGHHLDGDLRHRVGLQAQRGPALEHHAADEVLTHREHDVKKYFKRKKKVLRSAWNLNGRA